MSKIYNNLFRWYISKQALPYWCVLIVDIAICYLSGIFVFWLYYRGAVTLGNLGLLSRTIAVYMIFNLIGFRIFHTYSGIIRYSSFVDLQRIAMAQALSCFMAEIFHYIIYPLHIYWHFKPLAGRQILAMYVIATICMWGVRVLVKAIYDVSVGSKGVKRTLIYGVGDHGIGLAKNIRNIKNNGLQFKGFISHDPSYNNRILLGERVYQPGEKLEEALVSQNIQAVIVSPAQAERFRNDTELQDMLIGNGVTIYLASMPKNWEPDSSTSVQLHEVKIEDLLPRDEIQVDMTTIASQLHDRRIMITGSAGSIGSEMVRQIAPYGPAELILIDQAETPQHDVRLMMRQQFPDLKVDTYVASIANRDRMEDIFRHKRPDYVFHAAAYKHVPMMEDNPSESIQNNVWGTKVIADLSVKYGAKKFVMISTDKAVNPSNVMGCSKRICEIYCQSLDRWLDTHNADGTPRTKGTTHTQFVTTRFGNVLGSNGSVIPLFKRQIQDGGPVTVTHPDIIRFFMLIPEACKLVLEAGTRGLGGQIFIFDMGKPVRIADLARRMIRLSGAQNVEIKFTGLRPGEKLYEEVLANEEDTLPSFHKKIRVAKVRRYDYDAVERDIEELCKIAGTFDDMAIVRKMKEIVPEYISLNSKYSVLDKPGAAAKEKKTEEAKTSSEEVAMKQAAAAEGSNSKQKEA